MFTFIESYRHINMQSLCLAHDGHDKCITDAHARHHAPELFVRHHWNAIRLFNNVATTQAGLIRTKMLQTKEKVRMK